MIKSKLTQISLLRTIGSISFFSFLLFSCELFTPDEDSDLWKKLDNDIAWDNASRLTVTVAYPQEWGASPQYGRNRCYDIARTSQLARAGFAFEVEFTPDILYSVQRWRAYKTSDITREALGGDWLQDQSLLNNNNVQELKDVKFPNLRGRGGKGNFIINTTEPVTLIPWCRAEPYVIKTEPQTSSIPDPGEQWVYDFTQPIKIYFNEALDPDTDWRFEKPEESAEGEENIGIVWIRARSNSSENFEDKTGWFKTT
ncbi:MAG: hypothetical protein LBU66_00930, partial [Treponema sp.]|nr:hypothetical protein [Treponema sp.]